MNLSAFRRSNDLRRFRRVVEKNPGILQRTVLLKEILQAFAKAPTDDGFRNSVAALPDTIRYSRQRKFDARNPEKEQVNCIAFPLQSTEQREIGRPRKGCFK